MRNLVITNIKKIFTPLPELWKFREYSEAAVVITDGKLESIHSRERIYKPNYPIFDAKGMVALPGFVDSHTHPVFAETREKEF